MKPYTLQYASNFFLNLHKRHDYKKLLVPSSENLALLGDICSVDSIESHNIYKSFLDYCSKEFKKVYIVPGVWELSSYSPKIYDETITQLYKLNSLYNNIKVLDNSSTHIPHTDILLVGSLLWLRNPYMYHPCMFEYNFMYIQRHSGIGKVMGEDFVNWHCEDVGFLRDELKDGHRYIILTHHQPHPILINDIGRKRMESSNLEKMLKKPIEIWLGGAGDHTVSGCFGYSHDVFCATNPYTTFSAAKNRFSESYNPEAVVSLRVDRVELV